MDNKKIRALVLVVLLTIAGILFMFIENQSVLTHVLYLGCFFLVGWNLGVLFPIKKRG